LVDYEIIIVDDGSTDDTQAYLTSLGNRITTLSQDNRGPGAARNLGARQAKGEYCAFLDSDDLWFPWTLSCFRELIERYEHPAVLTSKVIEFSDNSELVVVKEGKLKAERFPDYYAAQHQSYFVGAGMSVLRREEFLRTQGYSTHITNSEDHDLAFRMGLARGFVQIVEPVTLAYRRHPGGLTRDRLRSFHGASYLVEQERSGQYPGGRSRARARRALITKRTRPVTLALARNGLLHESWALYRATFLWNLVLGRWRFLVGFPILFLHSWISRRTVL
jgi:GT2 family glycosyltransferase